MANDSERCCGVFSLAGGHGASRVPEAFQQCFIAQCVRLEVLVSPILWARQAVKFECLGCLLLKSRTALKRAICTALSQECIGGLLKSKNSHGHA